ncbi:MAG: adenosylmethionine decarboxylase [Defluviicoccus sp.]|nr:adenosylmethionine decarboxylase [Defluviicoccus sp.]
MTDRSAPAGDYLVRSEGAVHAGTHLLIDFWDARHLDDIAVAEAALREAAEACGATILHIHVHRFEENGGLSGVAVLAESHISVHTWPEIGYAAFDVFMCGSCEPHEAVPVLRRHYRPAREAVEQRRRGVVG